MQTSHKIQRSTTNSVKPWIYQMNGAVVPDNELIEAKSRQLVDATVGNVKKLNLVDLSEKLEWLIECEIINEGTIKSIMAEAVSSSRKLIHIGEAIKHGINRFVNISVYEIEQLLGVEHKGIENYLIDYDVNVEYDDNRVQITLGRLETADLTRIDTQYLNKDYKKLAKAFVGKMGFYGCFHTIDGCMEMFGWGFAELFSDNDLIKKHGMEKIEQWIDALEKNPTKYFEILPVEVSDYTKDNYAGSQLDEGEYVSEIKEFKKYYLARRDYIFDTNKYEFFSHEKLCRFVKNYKSRTEAEQFFKHCVDVFFSKKKEVNWHNVENIGDYGLGDGLFVAINPRESLLDKFEEDYRHGHDVDSSSIGLYVQNDFNVLYNVILAFVIIHSMDGQL